VFVYDGLLPETVVADLNKRAASSGYDKSNLPDFVFNYRRGYMVMRWRRDGGHFVPVTPGEPFEVFAHITSGADTLPLFFLTANICLNQVRLRSPDLNAYWKQVVTAVTLTNK
jgi:hypothetical protein